MKEKSSHGPESECLVNIMEPCVAESAALRLGRGINLPSLFSITNSQGIHTQGERPPTESVSGPSTHLHTYPPTHLPT